MVQSRIKALERLPVLVPVEKEAEVSLKFPDIEKLSGCVIQLAEVTFAYPDNPACFTNVDLSANASSRICIVRIHIRCGRVIRDFEREAKTRCNF